MRTLKSVARLPMTPEKVAAADDATEAAKTPRKRRKR
jgi:hypothetical protein